MYDEIHDEHGLQYNHAYMRKAYTRVWVASMSSWDDMMILSGDSKKAQNNGNDHRLCSDSDHRLSSDSDHRLCSDSDHLYSNSHDLCSGVSQSSNDGSSGHQYNSSEYSGHCSGQNNGLNTNDESEFDARSDNGSQSRKKRNQTHSHGAHSSRKCQSQN